METFLLTFIPLFVAIDVFGVLPLFVGLTEHMAPAQRKKLTAEAVLTAFAISLTFLVSGSLLFSFLGITESDFRVGGGVVLLVLAVHDLLFSDHTMRVHDTTVGVVPIGIPLIMGPAALTTIIFLVQSYGYVWAVSSLLVNLLIVWGVFDFAPALTRMMGKAGSRAVAKVASLFMAGIAVMMIRSGVLSMVKGAIE